MDRLNLNIYQYLGSVLYAFNSVSQEKEVNMANWNEADHPRDDIGRFTDKGGGSSTTKESYERKSQSREDILYQTMNDKNNGTYRNKLLYILGNGLSRAEILYSSEEELENKIIDSGLGDKLDKLKQQYRAVKSFGQNYHDLREANTKYADKYFHSKANCQAAQYGLIGAETARKLSNLREIVDLPKNIFIKKLTPAETTADYFGDQAANIYGRTQGLKNPNASCKILVNKYRPNGLYEKY